ncbi:3-ketoacyl-CoA thiolase A, peroxisomal-like [Marmota flaviventris]|uniref:3-ketoacyl-CoA thiolase A, peroxisomal-like n=1 Tax=Marmota flaviventris TaxID=93162 RepID=UPI003A887C30
MAGDAVTFALQESLFVDFGSLPTKTQTRQPSGGHLSPGQGPVMLSVQKHPERIPRQPKRGFVSNCAPISNSSAGLSGVKLRLQVVQGHLTCRPESGPALQAAPCFGNFRQASAEDVVVVHGWRTALGKAGRGVFKVEFMSMGWNLNPGNIASYVRENKKARDCLIPMGITSENVAEWFGVSREKQDTFAVASQQEKL